MQKKKKKQFGKRLLVIALVGLLTGAAAGGGYCGIQYYKSEHNRTGEQNAGQSNEDNSADNSAHAIPTAQLTATPVSSKDVSAVVNNVMPAIVSITSTSMVTQTDFFGRVNKYEATSSGSGIIVGQNDNELLLVTNEHVVSDSIGVTITLCDGTVLNATIKGSDENADIAVLSVPMSKLSDETKASVRIATLGDSDTLSTGEMAIAIGNALGYGQSVTVGYISALNREVTVNDVARVLIQTDAAINPGNSGGALLNANGEVIGINSVKYASTDVERIGYAIPISDAIPIINDLMNREELKESEAGYLGILGQTVTSSYSSRYGIPVGIYVNKIEDPARSAGIGIGDIIIGISGITVSTTEDLQTILDYTRAGTQVTVTFKTLENNQYVEKNVSVILSHR